MTHACACRRKLRVWRPAAGGAGPSRKQAKESQRSGPKPLDAWPPCRVHPRLLVPRLTLSGCGRTAALPLASAAPADTSSTTSHAAAHSAVLPSAQAALASSMATSTLLLSCTRVRRGGEARARETRADKRKPPATRPDTARPRHRAPLRIRRSACAPGDPFRGRGTAGVGTAWCLMVGKPHTHDTTVARPPHKQHRPACPTAGLRGGGGAHGPRRTLAAARRGAARRAAVGLLSCARATTGEAAAMENDMLSRRAGESGTGFERTHERRTCQHHARTQPAAATRSMSRALATCPDAQHALRIHYAAAQEERGCISDLHNLQVV